MTNITNGLISHSRLVDTPICVQLFSHTHVHVSFRAGLQIIKSPYHAPLDLPTNAVPSPELRVLPSHLGNLNIINKHCTQIQYRII